jgi:1-acyl-sn-glycerol-3-phosphate acyltransferase
LNQIELLTDILAKEAAETLGWEGGRPGRSVVRALLRPAARRIAREFAACDQVLAAAALPDAARWILEHFSASVETAGLDRVPRQGPILLVANHPGLTDVMALIAALDRPDVRIVAADYPFLHAMRGLGARLIFLSSGATSPLGWIRAVSRDLRQGGAVLLFPAGRLEPDPVMLGTRTALLPWSESVGIISRHVPEAHVVPAAVSGVHSERAFMHPLTHARRAPLDRQRVATLLQMIDVRSRPVTARVAFGEPIALDAGANMSSQLSARMNQLICDPPLIWAALTRRRSDSLTTTAA